MGVMILSVLFKSLAAVPAILLSTNPYDYPRQRLPRYPVDLLKDVTFPTETIFQLAQQPAMFSREDESDDGDFCTSQSSSI
jgi:hypothetical protein